jgi:uncharacterized protein
MLSAEALVKISSQAGAPVSRVEATISLLESGATVPFIARYRKEATGHLDEAKIREIDELRSHYRMLDERRQAMLASIEKQNRLTEELKARILGCFVKVELDDLYLPYRSKRKTRSQAAIWRGLAPLAEYIWEQSGEEPVEVYAERFITPAPTVEPALAPAPSEPGATPVSEAVESAGTSEESKPLPEGSVVVAAYDILTGADITADTANVSTEPVQQAVSEPVTEAPSDSVTAPAANLETEQAPVPAETASDSVAAPVTNLETEQAPVPAETASDSVAAPVANLETEQAPAPAEASSEQAAAPPTPSGEPAAAPSAGPAQPRAVFDRSVRSAEEAVNGALDILAERVGEHGEFRKLFRERLWKEGVVRARALPGKENEKTKYEMYYKFEEPVAKIPSHRMLAIRRGARETVLSYTIEIDRDKFVAEILASLIKVPGSSFSTYLGLAVRDGYDRLIAPSIQTEVRSALRERSENEAIRVFEENLRALLLAPPAGPIAMLGIDPGLRNGCRVVAIDGAGKLIEHHVIRPAEPNPDLEGAEKTLVDLISRTGARGIAIGNGAGSREAESFARSILQKHALDVFVIVVNEAGASVYAASKRAREEFPNLDIAIRGAVSIARRLQDPLAELVKIEPRSIGVGQYQHDVDQKKLKSSLAAAVESAVNRVGVDVNAASVDLLKYVAGFDEKLAAAVSARRERAGAFRSREELRGVEGVNDRIFEQAAGFLRIAGADHPLDRTAIHPESYPLVERIAQSVNVSVQDLIENHDRVRAIDFRALEAEAGRLTLADIRDELLRPGRDPRERFAAPKFRDDVKELADLKDGMELEGAVTNVTNFGAFIDIGVHQDGLVHISELSHKYIQDARHAVKVGDIVKVKVIAVDTNLKRISLSIKAAIPKPPRPHRPRRARPQAGPQNAPVASSMEGSTAAAAAGASTGPTGARAPKPHRQDQRPRPAPRPQEAGPRKSPDRPRSIKPHAETTVSSNTPKTPKTMEEMIRQLQEKFGRVG